MELEERMLGVVSEELEAVGRHAVVNGVEVVRTTVPEEVRNRRIRP